MSEVKDISLQYVCLLSSVCVCVCKMMCYVGQVKIDLPLSN